MSRLLKSSICSDHVSCYKLHVPYKDSLLTEFSTHKKTYHNKTKAAAHVAVDLQCWHCKDKYFRSQEENPGGELTVALARHQVTCGSKPGVGGIFFLLWPFSVSCYLSLGFSSKVSSPCT